MTSDNPLERSDCDGVKKKGAAKRNRTKAVNGSVLHVIVLKEREGGTH